jgi:iron complex transport system permease protein
VSVAGASLIAGSTGVEAKAALAALLGDLAEPARTVVMDLRLPRVLSAFGIGALLAVAIFAAGLFLLR